MWLEGIILLVAVEALVELWKKAAPLQGIKQYVVIHTPFLYSIEQRTHLMECPYCMSVWIGAMVFCLYMVSGVSIYIFSALAIHRISNYIHIVVSFLRDKQLNLRANRGRVYHE